MTQIRSMSQPTPRRPGELGVHSLDHFNFVVPDVAQAEKFYSLFGLNTKEEDGKLALYTEGHPHRWGVVRKVRARNSATCRSARSKTICSASASGSRRCGSTG